MEEKRYRSVMEKTAAELHISPEALEKSLEEMLALAWERPEAMEYMRLFGFPDRDERLSARTLVDDLYAQALQDCCEQEED